MANYIAIWHTPNYLLSSVMYQNSAGDVGVGTTNPAATPDVNGNINSATTYGTGERTVLTIGSSDDTNTFVGVGAGANNQAGSGVGNNFIGSDAGNGNTSGQGNTFTGYEAGQNSIGPGANNNVFVGYRAGNNSTSSNNVFVGTLAGHSETGADDVLSGICFVDLRGCVHSVGKDNQSMTDAGVQHLVKSFLSR